MLAVAQRTSRTFGRPLVRSTVLAFGLGLSACGTVTLPGFRAPDPPTADTTFAAAPIWAQAAATPGEDGLERLWIVFDHEIDPSTVSPWHFVLVYDDGGRAAPRLAHFGDADERGELRSLVLEGDFADAEGKWHVEQVQIRGELYAQNGASLAGSDVRVAGPGAPRAVAASWMPSEAESGACAGASLLRTWWSGEVEAAPELTGVGWQRAKGAALAPVSVEDVAEARPDNVVDFCFEGRGTGSLELERGAVRGLDGKESFAMSLPLLFSEEAAG